MIEPLEDNVLLSIPEVEEVKEGLIIVPETARKEACERVVEALGPKATMYGLVKGDRVIREKIKAREVQYNGKVYEVVKEEFIRAKL